MPTRSSHSEPRHPIGVVSARSGIAQDVLRAWERRYGAVIPHRTPTGRRLYCDDDIRRFRLLKQLVEGGRRISDVAPLPGEDLERLVAEDREAAEPTPVRAPAGGRDFLEGALAAIRDLDASRLARVLADASMTMSPAALREDLVCALLRETGRRWRRGDLRIAHEHLATAVIRSFLGARRPGGVAGATSPCVLLGAPAGQRHEIGALLAAAAAEEVGWRALYVGADLPAEEIAAAAEASGARALGISLVGVPGDSAIHDELRRLRSLVGRDRPILVGGDVAGTYATTLREIDAPILASLPDFQEALDDLRARGG